MTSDDALSIYGLIGRRLGHSFSVEYFADKFQRHYPNCRYWNFELLDIRSIPSLISTFPALRGFNVTIPYKEAIIPFLDEMTETARLIGAVNCVKLRSEGDGAFSLVGHNTDYEGFGCMFDCFVPQNYVHKALILGTGGAARSVKTALCHRGIESHNVSRTPGKADMTYADLSSDMIVEYQLIVQTTPLGMYPDISSAPAIPYMGLSPLHYCIDLVYNPTVTEFMRRCAMFGGHVLNGLEMLHIQADAAWIWWRQ